MKHESGWKQYNHVDWFHAGCVLSLLKIKSTEGLDGGSRPQIVSISTHHWWTENTKQHKEFFPNTNVRNSLTPPWYSNTLTLHTHQINKLHWLQSGASWHACPHSLSGRQLCQPCVCAAAIRDVTFHDASNDQAKSRCVNYRGPQQRVTSRNNERQTVTQWQILKEDVVIWSLNTAC